MCKCMFDAIVLVLDHFWLLSKVVSMNPYCCYVFKNITAFLVVRWRFIQEAMTLHTVGSVDGMVRFVKQQLKYVSACSHCMCAYNSYKEESMIQKVVLMNLHVESISIKTTACTTFNLIEKEHSTTIFRKCL